MWKLRRGRGTEGLGLWNSEFIREHEKEKGKINEMKRCYYMYTPGRVLLTSRTTTTCIKRS